MLRATTSCRLYRTVINQSNWRHLLLMRNRCKILLRDSLVLEVYHKTCPKHYTVSAVPETRAARGPNKPYTNWMPSCSRTSCSFCVLSFSFSTLNSTLEFISNRILSVSYNIKSITPFFIVQQLRWANCWFLIHPDLFALKLGGPNH